MKTLTCKQIEEGTGGVLVLQDNNKPVTSVSIDSRTCKEQDLFFPIIGEKHDAHDFIPQAIEKGCKNFVVSKQEAENFLREQGNINVFRVEDTTKALQNLASFYLAQLDIKKIAVTGSTGKTTTKDMVRCVCSSKFKTYSNEGNFNNHIGVPLTILSFEEDAQVGVIEMGMDKFGEIDCLAQIVRPDIGIITNIGVSHVENLGSREGIFQAKMELTNYFDESSKLIICQDEEFLNTKRISGSYELITIGEKGYNNFIISGIDDFGEKGIQFTLEHDKEIQRFTLSVPGSHNAFNASLAAACGLELGISMKTAAKALQNLKITDKRLSVKARDGIKVIDDTYNASPASMLAGIDVLCATKGIRRVAVLGDMFELGEEAPEYHRQVGAYAGEKNIDLVIAIGQLSKYIEKGALEHLKKEQVKYYTDKEKFLDEIHHIITKGDVVLVKGSRGMSMDEIVKKIVEQ